MHQKLAHSEAHDCGTLLLCLSPCRVPSRCPHPEQGMAVCHRFVGEGERKEARHTLLGEGGGLVNYTTKVE